MKVQEYLDEQERSPFRSWFDTLDVQAAAKVSTALTRLSLGNTSNTKSVGAGILELKIDFGKGFRIYFGKDGEQLVILLGGGTKQRQQNDIATAIQRWQNYRLRKKGTH
jgi:putative addiction module killer protein